MGAGGERSTAWIYGADPKGISQVRKHFEDTADHEIGRVVIPFEIEPKGIRFINFEKTDLKYRLQQKLEKSFNIPFAFRQFQNRHSS